MLSRAISSKLENFVAPKRGDGFEDLCLDLFGHVLSKVGLPIIGGPYTRIVARGVSGNSQHGVDIYDPATRSAAQCKNQATVTTSHLEEELRKLRGFDKPVAHYFFLLGRKGVSTSLQDWVDEANQRRAEAVVEDPSTAAEGVVASPMLHILGWPELKGYLFESNFLMWKWGVAHPVIHQYPYLPTLDVQFLTDSIGALKAKLDVLPDRQESRDAVAGLLRTVDVEGLVDLVANERVEREVFDGLTNFNQACDTAWRVAKQYSVAVKDVDSRDPIIMEQGFAMMNDIARFIPRISALGYLRNLYRASRQLLDLFVDDDSHGWAPVEYEHEGGIVEDDGDTTLTFNFKREDWTSQYYVEPGHVDELVQFIVRTVRRANEDVAVR